HIRTAAQDFILIAVSRRGIAEFAQQAGIVVAVGDRSHQRRAAIPLLGCPAISIVVLVVKYAAIALPVMDEIACGVVLIRARLIEFVGVCHHAAYTVIGPRGSVVIGSVRR